MEFPELAARWGIKNLLIKDDGRLPTGSFKDRASAVGTAKAIELGFDTICCASTGNAASSLAGFSANMGLRAYIFVPAHAPEGKVAQLRIFKSNVLLVEGSYDEAYYLCQEAAQTFGWYNRNCAINPYLIEGKKTSGLEAAEQLAGRIPDWVSVAVGDGCTIAGIWKGFVEMKRFGIIDKLPRLLGVQAAGAQPIYDAFQAGDETLRPMTAEHARRFDRGRAAAQSDQGAARHSRVARRHGLRRGRRDPCRRCTSWRSTPACSASRPASPAWPACCARSPTRS